MKEYVIRENEAGQRFDKYLKKLMKQAPAGFLYKMLRKKNITLNGHKASGAEILMQEDQVRIFFSDETMEKMQGEKTSGFKAGASAAGRETSLPGKPSAGMLPGKLSFREQILYEDRHVLILNKPAGVLSQPDASGSPSMVEALTGYLLESGALTSEELATFRPSVCNRLDRNTSGILLAGKTLPGLQALSAALKERKVHKYYRCLALGSVTDAQKISGYLQKDPKCNKVTIQKEESPGFSRIETSCVPLARAGGTTLLEVELITGKTHQIRAHLAGIGHPLIGDVKYGDRDLNRQFRQKYGITRQMLHAFRVTFEAGQGVLEPLNGRSFTAPLPEDFARLMSLLYPPDPGDLPDGTTAQDPVRN